MPCLANQCCSAALCTAADLPAQGVTIGPWLVSNQPLRCWTEIPTRLTVFPGVGCSVCPDNAPAAPAAAAVHQVVSPAAPWPLQPHLQQQQPRPQPAPGTAPEAAADGRAAAHLLHHTRLLLLLLLLIRVLEVLGSSAAPPAAAAAQQTVQRALLGGAG